MTLTVFSGGFAPLGGIESFLCAVLPAMSARGMQCRLCCWDGASPRHNPRLHELEDAGVAVDRSPWRWGCRWNWPDKLLLASARTAK